MRRLLIPLVIFLGLAVFPIQADAKPLRGASECVRFYVELAQNMDGPSTFVGRKVQAGCTGR
jgi:hypothetical protein